ncbi:hypothetical protein VTK73DRAFT_9640 [Phialemonium thermophilum]|uniref:Uncharacterized protein n=1 Tax=Phialemonium thermophilum TaxID=223376 RepID=A0ABR3W1F3_9PEZI
MADTNVRPFLTFLFFPRVSSRPVPQARWLRQCLAHIMSAGMEQGHLIDGSVFYITPGAERVFSIASAFRLSKDGLREKQPVHHFNLPESFRSWIQMINGNAMHSVHRNKESVPCWKPPASRSDKLVLQKTSSK